MRTPPQRQKLEQSVTNQSWDAGGGKEGDMFAFGHNSFSYFPSISTFFFFYPPFEVSFY